MSTVVSTVILQLGYIIPEFSIVQVLMGRKNLSALWNNKESELGYILKYVLIMLQLASGNVGRCPSKKLHVGYTVTM